MSSKKTIAEYVASLDSSRRKLVKELIALTQEAASDAKLSIKWAQPVFEVNGPVCYIKAFKSHVNFGFWRGAELSGGDGIVSSGGKMGHVKIASIEDLNAKQLQKWVREAVRLNRAKGDPTMRRSSK